MSNKKYKNKNNNVTPNTPVEKKAEVRDFGLLKVRSMKVKQSQAVVFRETKNKSTTNYANMDNNRLI